MDKKELITILGLLISISGMLIALITFTRKEKRNNHQDGKNQGIIISDIGFIKACIERIEKNLTIVDERYRNVVERLAKVEENLENIHQIVDNLIINKKEW